MLYVLYKESERKRKMNTYVVNIYEYNSRINDIINTRKEIDAKTAFEACQIACPDRLFYNLPSSTTNRNLPENIYIQFDKAGRNCVHAILKVDN